MSPPPAPSGTAGHRRAVLLALAVAGAWSFFYLGLHRAPPQGVGAGVEVAARFFARAVSPALQSEADFVPAGTPPLLVIGLQAAWRTAVFAAAAMSLALLGGLILGFFASTAWWADDAPRGGRRRPRVTLPLLYLATRGLIAWLRSIHELLWALLFVTAMGVSELAGVVAIAIPFAGTFAKVFSELIDEAPRDAAGALAMAGGGGAQVYLVALLPRAFPDLVAYAFYRFECALRSSAVLGFFGFPTLGLEIRQSFKAGNYGEVWTYLYLLLALVLLFDQWSGAVRRRLVS